MDMYAGNVERYLKFCKTDYPSEEDYARFKRNLFAPGSSAEVR